MFVNAVQVEGILAGHRRIDAPLIEAAAAFVSEIVTIATRYGGTYDGWGSELLQSRT